MKFINGTIHSYAPRVEPLVLARFVKEKCQEALSRNGTRLAPIWVALASFTVADDGQIHARLKEFVDASSGKSKKAIWNFESLFHRLYAGNSTRSPEASQDEITCKQVLRHALHEGKQQITSGRYEFSEVFQLLAYVGLQPYSFRLYQFQALRESFKDDPENLVRKSMEVIGTALGSPREKK